jgi:hypothetical protein
MKNQPLMKKLTILSVNKNFYLLVSEEVSAELVRKGVLTHPNAINTTLVYLTQWMSGSEIDFTKSSVKIHRARLRKIGIDIKDPCPSLLRLPVAYMPRITRIDS